MTKLPFFISLILFLSVPCSQARPESGIILIENN